MESPDSTTWVYKNESHLALSSSAGETADQDVVRTMVQDAVQEIVRWQPDTTQEEEEHESHEDFDSEGQLILDFEDDAEYSEPETLQILAYRTGRAQVRRDLVKDKTKRGFRPPPAARGRDTNNDRRQTSQVARKDKQTG